MVLAIEFLRIEEAEDGRGKRTSDDCDGYEVVGWALLEGDCHWLLFRSMAAAILKPWIQDSLSRHLHPMRALSARQLRQQWAGW